MSCPTDIATKAYVDALKQRIDAIENELKKKEDKGKFPDLSSYLKKTEFKGKFDANVKAAGLATIGMIASLERILKKDISAVDLAFKKADEGIRISSKQFAEEAKKRANLAKKTADKVKTIADKAKKTSDNLQGKFNALNGKLNNLLNRFGNLGNKLNSIATVVGKLAPLIGIVGFLLSLVGLVQGFLNKKDLFALRKRVQQHDKELSLHLGYITTNRYKANNNRERLDDLEKEVSRNERAIGSNSTRINQVFRQIKAINSKISSFDSRIGKNKSDIKNLRKELKNDIRELENLINSLPPEIKDQILREIDLESLKRQINNNKSDIKNIFGKIGKITLDVLALIGAYQLLKDLPNQVNSLKNLFNNFRNTGGKGKVITNNYFITKPTVHTKEIIRENRIIPYPVTQKIIEKPQIKTDPTIKPLILKNQQLIKGNQKLNFSILGRVSSLINYVQDRFSKIINSRAFDKTIDFMNLMFNLHNAFMLSRNLGETFIYMIENGLSLIGIKDDDGNAINLSEKIGDTVENLITNIIGTETYNNLNKQINSLNRIYEAGINTLWTMRNIFDDTHNLVETNTEYTAKIGNALRNNGAVRENSYEIMEEKISKIHTPTDRFTKFFDKVEDVEDRLSTFDQIIGDVQSINDGITELGQNRADLQNSIRDYQDPIEEKRENSSVSESHIVRIENQELENENKLNSESPIDFESIDMSRLGQG